MADIGFSIRLDLTDCDSIGPRQDRAPGGDTRPGIDLRRGAVSWMSYRRAWLLVEQINKSLSEPAVTAATGGASGGGAALTLVASR